MRVTIVPADNFVSVDGIGFGGIDLGFLASDIHAVQWYDTYGVVEIKDVSSGSMLDNQDISSLAPFQRAIDMWQEAKLAYEAEVERQMAEVITEKLS